MKNQNNAGKNSSSTTQIVSILNITRSSIHSHWKFHTEHPCIRSLDRREFLQSQGCLVLVLVPQAHKSHHHHVEQHQTGEEEEVVGLEEFNDIFKSQSKHENLNYTF